MRDLNENDFKSNMIKLIGQTHLNCGFKLDEKQIFETIDELCSDLQKNHTTISFEEIELAFKNGWKKQYGEFFGLNNATYFGWVFSYIYNETRLKVKKTLLEAKEKRDEVIPKKSEEEQDKILNEACLKCFEDFKKGVSIFDHGNVKYNFLVKNDIINFTKERKEAIKKRVEDRLKQYQIETKGKSETIENALKRLLPETIIFESRKQALIDFFEELIEMDEELSELLNPK